MKRIVIEVDEVDIKDYESSFGTFEHVRKMRTELINIYKFDELDEKVQEKVINKFRDNNDFPFLTNDLKYELETILKENDIKVCGEVKLYYSLTYSQGDGCMFEGKFEWDNLHITIEQEGYYYHKRSKTIEMWTEDESEVTDQEYEEFDTLYMDICEQLEKIGYAIIENERDEECIKENIKQNDYEFYEDGELV